MGAQRLVLASVGLYGVRVCFVRQRARELSIRVALGARPRRLVGVVVGRGMAMVGAGVGVGVLGGLAAVRLMRNLLFEVGAGDAVTFGGTGLGLGLVALIACLVPAWRAVRIEPGETLKAE